jgi:hypothetical protein
MSTTLPDGKSMIQRDAEAILASRRLPTCPPWCVESHEPAQHRSADVDAGHPDQQYSLNIWRSDEDAEPTIMVEGDPLTVDQAQEMAEQLLELVKVARS